MLLIFNSLLWRQLTLQASSGSYTLTGSAANVAVTEPQRCRRVYAKRFGRELPGRPAGGRCCAFRSPV
jgi:hypothetical protein